MNRFLNSKANFLPVQAYATKTAAGTIRTELPLKDPTSLVAADSQLVENKTSNKSSFFKRQIANRFQSISGGQLTIVDSHGTTRLGESTAGNEHLDATALVSNEAFYRRIVFGGTIGSAESYMAGEWVSDDLTSLIRLMIRNLDRFSNLEKGWARLKNVWYFLLHLRRKNSVEGSRQNIHEHYDLGNEFYQLFLDPTMNYSSGIFESAMGENETIADMTEASLRKMDQVCRKLQLKPGESVLEIGTGWGGLAIHMAKHFGCRVTTTTISEQQHRLAVERVKREGLEDRIHVLLKDYRALTGKFDKIVSIEMIEAVGHQFYDEYFARCSELLEDDGAMLLQSITMGERDFDYHIRHVDFIRKYVFPGGCLPCVSALTRSVGRVSNMRMLYQEDITPHYVKTLRFWRTQFMNKLDDVRSLGYSDSFIRLWHFYLCYCEAAFAERRVHNIHLMFAKPNCSIDPAVDFADEEHGLRNGLCPELSCSERIPAGR